ncbi:hypothetical protein ACSBL2_12750 [Pedobacter sp. AW31-3R]|uniref:hypothetical protein n=1 Tax=Pedobacter sp. AW31-3R TaxID=3445781 RepID=UPI003F9F00E6
MKENNFCLDYDGNNIYITVGSNIALSSRCFLIICNFIVVCGIVFSLLQGMYVFTTGAFVFLSFLMRYTIWNLFGKEIITINAKAITYRKTYLFFSSPLLTRGVGNKLTVVSYDIHVYRQSQQVKVILETCYNGSSPENLYEFSFPLTTDQAEMVNYVVSLLYLNKITFNFQQAKYSLN